MQFSNDVRVELPLEPLNRSAFHTLMASMVRVAASHASSCVHYPASRRQQLPLIVCVLTCGRLISAVRVAPAGQTVQ